MDRYEADWSMVERGWRTHVRGEGRGFPSCRQAILTFRDEKPGIGDQMLPDFVVVAADATPIGAMRDADAVVLFNFRGDRAIEITQAFENDAFPAFDRGVRPDVLYLGMMEYDGDLRLPSRFLVTPPKIDRTLGEYIARAGLPQLAISETQKFGHVTYFWNGNRSGAFDADVETYIEVPSDLRPFEERPWMKAAETTDRLIEELQTGRYRHARVNYANGDMVGHTGKIEAAVQAVQTLDGCMSRLKTTIDEVGGQMLITADHGNCEEMRDAQTGKPHTSHTMNAVPFILAAGAAERGLSDGCLADIAPTLLELLALPKPTAMTGRSLLRRSIGKAAAE